MTPGPLLSSLRRRVGSLLLVFAALLAACGETANLRPNFRPFATSEVLSTQEDTPLTGQLVGRDVDGNRLVFVVLTRPSRGALELAEDGKFKYTPAPHYNGPDRFEFHVVDAAGEASAKASVDITVRAVADPLRVLGQRPLVTAEDTPLALSPTDLIVEDADGVYPRGFSVVIAEGPGYVADGNRVVPTRDFTGELRVPVTATDGARTTPPSFVAIVVTRVNDAPLIQGQEALTVRAGDPLELTFAHLRVTDVDSAYPADFTLRVGDGANYARVGNTLTPVASFSGNITVPVTVNDGAADSNTFPLMVQVTARNIPPTITGQTPNPVVLTEDSSFTVTFAHLVVTDPDNAYPTGFTLTVLDSPTGAYTRSGNTITPALNFNGLLVVGVRVNDGQADSNFFELAVRVTEVNGAPTATADGLTTAEGTPLTLAASTLTANDSPGPANESTQTLTVTAVSAASTQGGTVSLSGGTITYTPPALFSGADTFTYTVTDNGQTNGANDFKTATGTVTVNVTGVNDAPTAGPDTQAAVEDTALTFAASALTTNDSPGPGEATQTLTVTAVSAASTQGGTVSLAGGNVTYAPAAHFNGVDTFTYTVTDNGQTNGVNDFKTATGTVTVNVAAVNDAPTAGGDARTTAEGVALTFAATTLTSNDSAGPANESAQTLSVTAVSATSTQGGTVALASGNVTYTPATNFNGTDTFTYTVTDNGQTSGANDFKTATGTVTVTVTAVNNAPTAGADTRTVAQDTPLGFAASTLTANDSPGPANESTQTLTVTAVSPTSTQGGTVTLLSGEVTYTPPVSFNGADTFTYTVTDNGQSNGVNDFKSATGTVTVNVTGVNDAPIAVPDDKTAVEDTALTFAASTLTANDSPGPGEDAQTLTVTAVSPASTQGGTVTLVGGNVTYTPAAHFNGVDTFTYTVTDNGQTNGVNDFKSDTETVTVTVTAVNDAPTAGADTKTAAEGAALTFAASTLTGNDSAGPANESTQTLTVTAVSAASAQGGTVALASGNVTYTPAANFNGTDTFTYTVTDNGQTNGVNDFKTATATVTVNVTAVNNAPTAGADARTTAESTALTFAASTLTTNDSAGPANESTQTLTVTAVTSPSAQGGTVSLVSGNITYTPATSFNGTDTFTYTVTDNGQTNGVNDFKSATGTVTVTVTELNDPPTAGNDTATTNEDTPLVLTAATLTANDSRGPANESAQTLTITAVGTPSVSGSTAVLSGGDITYTPRANFFGTDTFTYTITDNGTTAGVAAPKTATATVTVTVVSVNDLPVATADTYGTASNTQLSVNAAGGVLANDADVELTLGTTTTALVVSASSTTSTGGGTVAVASDGSFTYLPAAGFIGADTFNYTVRDGDTGTTQGTVTVNVAGPRIWYVNNSGANGDGRSTSPFNTLAGAQNVSLAGTTPTDGDIIFVFKGTAAYGGGILLKNFQKLIGEAAGLVRTPSAAIAPNAAQVPTLTNAGGAAVTVASGNVISHVIVDGSNGRGVTGTNVAGLTLQSSVVRNTSQTGVLIAGGSGAIAVTDTPVTNIGADAINVSGLAAGSTFTLSGGEVSSAAGRGIVVSNSPTVTLSLAGRSVSATGGAALDLSTITGTLTATVASVTSTNSTGNGVRLLSVAGGTLGVSSALTVTNAVQAGVSIKSSSVLTTLGSLTVTGGPLGVELEAAGATSAFTVGPDVGAVGVGGTISGQTGAGVSMNGVRDVTFKRVLVQNTAGDGFLIPNGATVTNFTFRNGTVKNTGNAIGKHAFNFGASLAPGGSAQLTGTALIDASLIESPGNEGLHLETGSGTLSLTLSNTTVKQTKESGTGVLLRTSGGATTVMIDTCTFESIDGAGDGVSLGVENASATLNATVRSSTFFNTRGHGDNAIELVVDGTNTSSTAVLQNNQIREWNGTAIVVATGDQGSTAKATITGNKIGVLTDPTVIGSALGHGIQVVLDADPGNTTTNGDFIVTGNEISNVSAHGIFAMVRDGVVDVSQFRMRTHILNNTLANVNGVGAFGVYLWSRSFSTVCARVSGNNSASPSGGGAAYRLEQSDSSIFNIEGTGAPVTFVAAENTGTPVTLLGTIVAVPANTCTIP